MAVEPLDDEMPCPTQGLPRLGRVNGLHHHQTFPRCYNTQPPALLHILHHVRQVVALGLIQLSPAGPPSSLASTVAALTSLIRASIHISID